MSAKRVVVGALVELIDGARNDLQAVADVLSKGQRFVIPLDAAHRLVLVIEKANPDPPRGPDSPQST